MIGRPEINICNQNSILKKHKKTSKNNLDRPVLILTMPSVSDDGYWAEMSGYEIIKTCKNWNTISIICPIFVK